MRPKYSMFLTTIPPLLQLNSIFCNFISHSPGPAHWCWRRSDSEAVGIPATDRWLLNQGRVASTFHRARPALQSPQPAVKSSARSPESPPARLASARACCGKTKPSPGWWPDPGPARHGLSEKCIFVFSVYLTLYCKAGLQSRSHQQPF